MKYLYIHSMIKGTFPIDKFRELETPFYYYDAKVLRDTLDVIRKEAGKYENYHVHYAVKANANPKVLSIIRESGLGADCVSGGEVRAAIKAGFPSNKIVYAGVGNGNIHRNVFPELENARKKGVIVVRSSRVPTGATTLDAEVDDNRYQFVASWGLNPQKARILLMLALTKTDDWKKIQEYFNNY